MSGAAKTNSPKGGELWLSFPSVSRADITGNVPILCAIKCIFSAFDFRRTNCKNLMLARQPRIFLVMQVAIGLP